MRGGTGNSNNAAASGVGLSPLARGNHFHAVAVVDAEGSIPACAGEPNAACALATSCGVYPRLRGGTRAALLQITEGLGLSPLARGNPGRKKIEG